MKASQVAAWAASEAVQIYGGVGYMLETPAARVYCDSKVLEIGEGTDEIRNIVVRPPTRLLSHAARGGGCR